MADLIKELSGPARELYSTVKNFSRGVKTALTSSVLSDSTLDEIHGIFGRINTGLNVLMGTMVVLILAAIGIMIYNATKTTSNLAADLIMITLAISATISFGLIRESFGGLDVSLFDKSGAFRSMKLLLDKFPETLL